MDERRGSKGACWASNATYKISCLKCKDEGRETHYLGETGFTCYTRGSQHLEGLKKRDEDNVLYAHNKDQHREEEDKIPNNPDQFKMEKLKQHSGCLERQSAEGIFIANELRERKRRKRMVGDENPKPLMILNSKKEFHQPGMISLKPTVIQYDGQR